MVSEMVQYSARFKAKMLKKMLPPDPISATALEKKVGVSHSSLSRWLNESRMMVPMANHKKKKKWTTAEKLRVIVESTQLRDEELGEFLRREGLHQAQLDQWRQAAEAAVSTSPKRKKASLEKKKIKELERELRRKEKALAEAAALLILKKKMNALYEARDNGTLDEYDS
jgi:transposase